MSLCYFVSRFVQCPSMRLAEILLLAAAFYVSDDVYSFNIGKLSVCESFHKLKSFVNDLISLWLHGFV